MKVYGEVCSLRWWGSGVNPGEQFFTASSDVHRIESNSLGFTEEVRVYFCVWQLRSDSLGESAPSAQPKDVSRSRD